MASDSNPDSPENQEATRTGGKRRFGKVLTNVVLALVLLAGAGAVAWQFYGEALQKSAWYFRLSGQSRQTDAAQQDLYYCPMHKDYRSDKPGNCPICSMQLVKLEKSHISENGSSSARPVGAASDGSAGMNQGVTSPQPSLGDANTIFISPQQQQVIGVQTYPATSRALAKEIRAVASATLIAFHLPWTCI